MANIYYPQNTRIIHRNTISSSYCEEVLDILPNVVFFFNSESELNWISSSVFSLTSSQALISNQSISSSYSNIKYINVDASEFIPRLTNGCNIINVETNTNFINRTCLAFDPDIIEYAQYWFHWPPGWTSATITFYWTSTSVSGSAVLYAGMRTFENASLQDGNFGEYRGVISTYTGSNICVTSTTNPIYPSGSINPLQRTVLQIYRDPTHPSDNLVTDLLLEGVVIYGN